jgi:hypothetical protein
MPVKKKINPKMLSPKKTNKTSARDKKLVKIREGGPFMTVKKRDGNEPVKIY